MGHGHLAVLFHQWALDVPFGEGWPCLFTAHGHLAVLFHQWAMDVPFVLFISCVFDTTRSAQLNAVVAALCTGLRGRLGGGRAAPGSRALQWSPVSG